MLPLDWSLLLEKYQEGKRGTIFWTTSHMDELFFEPLERMDIPFTPYWTSMTMCTSIFIPIGDKKKAGIRVRRVPDEHRALHAFCEEVQFHLKLKLTYSGESAGMLCHKLIQLLLVKRRETITDDEAKRLLDAQKQRCENCGDLLKKYEKHHKQAVAEGGANLIENIVLLFRVDYLYRT